MVEKSIRIRFRSTFSVFLPVAGCALLEFWFEQCGSEDNIIDELLFKWENPVIPGRGSDHWYYG